MDVPCDQFRCFKIGPTSFCLARKKIDMYVSYQELIYLPVMDSVVSQYRMMITEQVITRKVLWKGRVKLSAG